MAKKAKPSSSESDLESIVSEISGTKGLEDALFLMDGPIEKIPVIPTGIISLDIATGVGGVPRGRMIEVFGPESAGKTTIAYSVIAQAQKMGLVAAFIDAEQTFDPAYATSLGIDVHKLILGQPATAEEALTVIEALIRTGRVGLIALDSIASMPTEVELSGEIGQAHIGRLAFVMTSAVKTLTSLLSEAGTTLIMTNQLRQVIATGGAQYGPTTYTPGGNAIKHHASMRWEVRRYHLRKGDGKESKVVGSRIVVKIVKNKVAPPYGEASFEIHFGEGIDHYGMLMDLGEDYGVIERHGAWYSHGQVQIGQGRERAIEYLKENEELATSITELVRFRS